MMIAFVDTRFPSDRPARPRQDSKELRRSVSTILAFCLFFLTPLQEVPACDRRLTDDLFSLDD